MSGYGIFAQAYDGLTDDVQYARMAEYIAKRARREGLAQEDVYKRQPDCRAQRLYL